MDQAKIGRTEAAFREVNEAIAKSAARFEAEEADFVCECADAGCADRVTADLEDYEEVRADATHFLLSPGHHEPSVERVIEQTAHYDVVEKVGDTIAQIVRRLNPRANPAL
jgi:hypothetical protein